MVGGVDDDGDDDDIDNGDNDDTPDKPISTSTLALFLTLIPAAKRSPLTTHT